MLRFNVLRKYPKRRFGFMPAFLALCMVANVCAAATNVVNSINEIAGTTIDFEQPGSIDEILAGFNMAVNPPHSLLHLTFISSVTGNSSAPMSVGAMVNGPLNFSIFTTSAPWSEIGVSASSQSFNQDTVITMRAFDRTNNLLGSVTRVFAPERSFAGFNAAALFLGFSSTIPIYTIAFSSDNFSAYDNLRFNPIPEPSAAILLGAGFLGFFGYMSSIRDVRRSRIGRSGVESGQS